MYRSEVAAVSCTIWPAGSCTGPLPSPTVWAVSSFGLSSLRSTSLGQSKIVLGRSAGLMFSLKDEENTTQIFTQNSEKLAL